MTKQSPAPKAPDNNKRLAALEAGVSALAMALTANGITLEDGADPIATAVAAVKDLASLRAQVAQLADYLLANHPSAISADNGGAIPTAITVLEGIKLAQETAAEIAGNTSPDDATAAEGDIENDRLRARIVELEEEVKELNADVEDAMTEKNRLANELAGAGQSSSPPPVVDDQEEQAPETIAERVRPETARDVGPTAGGFASAEIAEMAASGTLDGLELVFSNGEFEIVALAPVPIGPKDLHNAEGRCMVFPPVYARLLNTDPQEELAGVGLLMNGEQIAYCAFPDRLMLQPGSERRFERAIYF